jgi:putative DNA primase/helicase
LQHDKTPLCEQYARQWTGILTTLGVPASALVNRHGPCPVCGGKDRFRYDDKDGHGTFFCNSCGAGDGPKLAMLFRGWDFRQLAAHLDGGLADAGAPPSRAAVAVELEETPEAKRQRMNRLWGKALPYRPTDPVGTYLASRLGQTPKHTGLRYQPHCPYPKGENWPAMLAIYVAPDDTACALHRTYLTAEGRKAPVVSGKLSLGPLRDGGAVRLALHEDELGIAEGIETALAASIMFGIPCWAALNAGRLAVWEPPANVRRVVIFADNDDNFAGQTAAFDLMARLEGKLRVSIETPTDTGTDWADMLGKQRRHKL